MVQFALILRGLAQTEGGYDFSQFKVDWKQEQVICPQGKKSTIWTPAVDHWGNEGIRVRFRKKDCLACSHRKHCVRSASGPRTLRFLPQAQQIALSEKASTTTNQGVAKRLQPSGWCGRNHLTRGESFWLTKSSLSGKCQSPFTTYSYGCCDESCSALCLDLRSSSGWNSHFPICYHRLLIKWYVRI